MADPWQDQNDFIDFQENRADWMFDPGNRMMMPGGIDARAFDPVREYIDTPNLRKAMNYAQNAPMSLEGIIYRALLDQQNPGTPTTVYRDLVDTSMGDSAEAAMIRSVLPKMWDSDNNQFLPDVIDYKSLMGDIKAMEDGIVMEQAELEGRDDVMYDEATGRYYSERPSDMAQKYIDAGLASPMDVYDVRDAGVAQSAGGGPLGMTIGEGFREIGFGQEADQAQMGAMQRDLQNARALQGNISPTSGRRLGADPNNPLQTRGASGLTHDEMMALDFTGLGPRTRGSGQPSLTPGPVAGAPQQDVPFYIGRPDPLDSLPNDRPTSGPLIGAEPASGGTGGILGMSNTPQVLGALGGLVGDGLSPNVPDEDKSFWSHPISWSANQLERLVGDGISEDTPRDDKSFWSHPISWSADRIEDIFGDDGDSTSSPTTTSSTAGSTTPASGRSFRVGAIEDDINTLAGEDARRRDALREMIFASDDVGPRSRQRSTYYGNLGEILGNLDRGETPLTSQLQAMGRGMVDTGFRPRTQTVGGKEYLLTDRENPNFNQNFLSALQRGTDWYGR